MALLVNSGYRPPAYNQEVGGALSSLHLDGLAADVSCLHVPFSRLAEAADRLWATGAGSALRVPGLRARGPSRGAGPLEVIRTRGDLLRVTRELPSS